MNTDFVALIGPVATRLWGQPNEEREGELRWGTNGSRKVDLAKGTWFDFENNEGGGVLDLIVKETRCGDKRAAHTWLVENRFVVVEAPTRDIIAEYSYTDEAGALLFQVVRFHPKDFRQRRPTNNGRGWIWNLGKVRRVPFNLPEVVAAVEDSTVIFIAEGEKDCLTLREHGLVATTCPGGANKWRQEYNQYFQGAACVVVLPDNDASGCAHSVEVSLSLHGLVRHIRIVDLAEHWPEGDAPEKADITDWLEAGGSSTKLQEIVESTTDWEPVTVETNDTIATAKGVDALSKLAKDTAKRVDELARLDPIAYDKVRIAEAKKLGIRASTLDNVVIARREELALEAEAKIGFLEPVELWDKAVKGDVLLGELHYTIERHIILGEGCSTAIALWVLHAHAHDAARHSPILLITSPTKRCGKTNLLALLTLLVPKPLSAANVTPATVFRAVERWHPTLLIDEGDTFLSDQSDLRGVLNSGHTRSQAYVLRCVGDDLVPKTFSTWAPKAFANIGRIHPTLEDRAIPIEMKRKLASERVKRLPKTADAYDELRRKCARWAADHIKALTAATPTLPELHDRARDNWEPLLAIAEACSEDWAELARTVAEELSAVDEDETYSIQLLQDLKWLFERERKNYPDLNHGLSSTEIVSELNQLEHRPWPEFSKNGKPITARGVSKLLKAFKVFPRKVLTIDGKRERGYREEWFQWIFKRYLG